MDQIIQSEFWSELYLTLQSWVISELPGLIIIVVVVLIGLKAIGIGINKIKNAFIKRAEEDPDVDTFEVTKRVNTLMSILYAVLRIVLFGLLIMIVLVKFGIQIAPLLASAGIVGLAVGFGAQELVRDLISGFFMLLENQVRTGDVAIINGTGGLVERIELRTITLRDQSGTVHIFQNGKINTLSNMTKDWSAMVLDIGVAYKEDVDNVIDIIKQVGDELQQDVEFREKMIEPIEVMGLDKFDDSALVIRARIKTKPIQQWSTAREYRKRLKKAFDENNIEIPFPHTTIYWGEEINPLKLEVDGGALKKSPTLKN
ncbi:MAG: mechanosensitive ion channel family protein [Bacteroidales bacterium]